MTQRKREEDVGGSKRERGRKENRNTFQVSRVEQKSMEERKTTVPKEKGKEGREGILCKEGKLPILKRRKMRDEEEEGRESREETDRRRT